MEDTKDLSGNGHLMKVVSAHESVQGRRWSMEDTCVVIDCIQEAFPSIKESSITAIYGVYDGHGGKDAAIVCEQLLHKNIIESSEFLEGNFEGAIREGFLKTDQFILNKAEAEGWSNGSTGVFTLITSNTLFVGNAGDSEAVIGRRAKEGYEPILVSEKHKPSNASEKSRIESAGGHVIFGRVLGSLAVSRAFGDLEFKKPYNKSIGDFVSAEPFVNKFQLTPECEFLIVACDGLWDKLTYQDAVDFVGNAKSSGKPANETVELLVKLALDKGSMDNITTIIVYFYYE